MAFRLESSLHVSAFKCNNFEGEETGFEIAQSKSSTKYF